MRGRGMTNHSPLCTMTISAGDRVPPASFPHVPYTPGLDDLVCDGQSNGPSTHTSNQAACGTRWSYR